jgi:hypothetical protein
MNGSGLTHEVRKLASVIALAMLLAASGCCGNCIVSQRYARDPNCGAELLEENDGVARRGVPVMAWPSSLGRAQFRDRTKRWRHDFAASLQPEPLPPTKPPHSRFHPLPTQHVFAPRAEYAAPALFGAELHSPPEAGLLAPPAEQIPIPLPDHDQHAPLPLPPGEASEGPMLDMQPPQLQSPPADPSRGTIAPTSAVQWSEPNPLRPAARAAR